MTSMSKLGHHHGGTVSASQSEDAFQQYRQTRYTAHITMRHDLDDLAFKTSERYDQWVLTLAGGALAISLTFIEKIAPEPKTCSWVLLGISWFLLIVAVFAGFLAIYYSREAIYRQIEICDERYNTFRETATADKPEGDLPVAAENRFVRTVETLNKVSLLCLGSGILFMCIFALVNLGNSKAQKDVDHSKEINLNANVSSLTNSILTVNTNKP